MKKKFLLITLMMCILGGINLKTLNAENTVTVVEGTTSTPYAPVYDRYDYSVSQQLYLASDLQLLPKDAVIKSITFFLKFDDVHTRTISVYVKNTSDVTNTIQSYTSNEMVFSGSITTGDQLMTIEFNKDFVYTGGGLYIYVNDETGSNYGNSLYAQFNATGRSGGIRANYGSSKLNESNLTRTYNYLCNLQITYEEGSSTPTPPTVTLNTPENGATDIFNPSLSFTLGNAKQYQIQMAEGTGAFVIVQDWTEGNGNISYQTNLLKSNTAYSWKVVAKNDDGETTSDVYTFTTKEFAAPDPITEVNPENGSELTSDPLLSWTFGENTEQYQVLLAKEDNELDIVRDWTNTQNATEASYQTSNLPNNSNYKWQVVTKNSVGETESAVFTFTKLGAPDNVTVVSPSDGATNVTSTILTWNFAENTTHYRVLMDLGNGDFEYVLGNNGTWIETTGVTASFDASNKGLVSGKEYKWCIDVKNDAGQRTVYQGGDEISIFSFTTASVLNTTYKSPENGATNIANAKLTWNYNGTPDYYQVLMGTEENELVAKTEWLAAEGTGGTYQTENLNNATQYYWQVNIKNGETVMEGEIWSFVTTLDVPQNVTATPENVYPGNTYPYNAVATVTWNAITNATYNVYVNGEKYNTEALTTNTCDVILDYNMDPGHSIQVSAIYPELGESEKSEAANVKVTGYVNVNGYVKDENENAIEGATVTLVGTDEFGVVYEDEIATTNEEGAYSGRVYAGTYNIVVEKDPYEDEISGLINFEYNNTVGYNVTLSADFIFTVSFKNVTADKISVYASNDNWTSPKTGYYNVYIKKGEEIIVDPELAWFSAEGETAVYNSEVINEEWFDLENGTYQIGVEMDGKNHINWGTIEREYSIFTTEGDWSNEENWRGVPGTDADVYIYAPATIAEDDVVAVKNVTIQKDGSLTINGSLTADNVSNEFGVAKLCINDGGQLRQTKNAELSGKFVKSINAPTNWAATSNVDGWQFISAPVADRAISAFVPEYVNYDLFKYDGTKEGAEWVNHKQTPEEIENEIPNDFETTFQQGRGYLASYQEEGTFTFSGELNNATTFDFDLTAFDDAKEWSKFTLLGNPFTFNMNIANLVGTGMEAGVAVINETGNGYSYMTNGEVKVGAGFFVKANSGTAMLSYEEGEKRGEENVPSINLIATSKAGNDNVIIRFADEENEGFNKLDNFDRSIAEIYVGNRYAIMSYDENTTEVEVSFHANEMGNYTIAAVPSGKFQTLTLVDRFTGIETNLLVEDYHFTATSSEDVNRFIVKLAVSGQQSAVSDNFVYQSGEELIVDAEGRVQIIDVMGRVVYSDDVESTNNRIDVSGFRNGTYVVRVINGSEVKVEKVVIY